MVRKEPVLTNAIILAFASALMVVLIEMGWVTLSDSQFKAWLGFFSAATVLGGVIVRSYVTPYFGDE